MKPCRCLPEGPDAAQLAEQIRLRVESLPEDVRAPQDVYMARLSVCRDCDRLLAGTCRACGCFVRLRAAKRAMGCPEEFWSPVEASALGNL